MKVDQQSATLYINVDTGSSATRGFALADFGDASPYEFFIHQLPNVEARRASEYENNKRRMNDRSSLVKFQQGNDWTYRIVGEISGHAGTKTDPNMSKSDELVPKVLAFVGLVIDRIPSIAPDEINVKLNFMLPISEWADYQDMESDLLSCLLRGFSYNGQNIDFAGAEVKGCMEGAGVATVAPKGSTSYVGVAGHKDMNFIAVEDGRPMEYPKSKTFEGLGMSSIVNSIKHFTDDVVGAKAVFRFISLMDRPKQAENARKELAALIPAHRLEQKLTYTREMFESKWEEVCRRIDRDRGIKQAEYFFLVGGNTYLWHKRFKDLFGRAFTSLDKALKELRDTYEEINSQWAYRALDIWLLHLSSTGRTWGQS